VQVTLAGFLAEKRTVSVTHRRIDGAHSSIRNKWEKLGSPDGLSRSQVAALQAVNEFEAVGIRDIPVRHGRATVAFDLPPDAVSYLVIR
jgi:beta-xylosidase